MNWQNILLKRNPFLDKWTRYCKECAKKGLFLASGKDPHLSAANEDYCYRCKKNTESGYTKNDEIIIFDRKGQQGVERQKKYDEERSKRLGSLREFDTGER